MTALDGTLAQSPSGGYVNPHVTVALRSVDPDWIGWPGGESDIGTAPASAMTHVIAQAHPRAINGTRAQSYMDDYYYRIHLRPDTLALGNISTAQSRSIEVWNAWPNQSRTLQSTQVTGVNGIDITAPEALPMTFAPLYSAMWQVTVGLTGPARVDATLKWLFAGGTTAIIVITGQRLTAWTVPPDWAQGVTESLAWLTDVQQALDGSGARRPVRAVPRREWEFAPLAHGQDRQVMDALLYDASARVYALPVWQDWQPLAADLAAGSDAITCATANRDFTVGDQVLLWRGPTVYELGEVSAITSDALTLAHPTIDAWPAGTRLYPCRQAALTAWPELTQPTDMLASATMRFAARDDCDWAAIAPAASYLDYPVLEDSQEWSQAPTAQYARHIDTLDNTIGTPTVDDFSGLAWPRQSQAWQLYGRVAQAEHRRLLYWLAGRARALWVPSWRSDITLTTPLAGNATSMTVALAYITRLGHRQPGRRHVRIELVDGSVFYREVTAATEHQSTETLALDSALGITIEPADVRRISWMMLATLAADRVEIQHPTDGDGIARCVASFAGISQEEP